MSRARRLHVLVVGIDVFRGKNLNKTRSLHRLGVRFTVLAMDPTANSAAVAASEPNVRAFGCGRGVPRLTTLWLMFSRLLRCNIDLVEIYPESAISLAFFLLARAFRRPVIVVARGLEHRIAEGRIRGIRLWALGVVYRGAAAVVCNELYMKDVLGGLGVSRLEFLPNSIELPSLIDRTGRVGCNFLYLNSMKAFRHPETAVAAFCRLRELHPELPVRLRVVGFREGHGYLGNYAKERHLMALTEKHSDVIELLPWVDDAEPHLRWGDVFLLPADIVFLNYALLEAMGSGMPAMIQDVDGAALIVSDGVEGAVIPNDTNAWADSMSRLARDPRTRARQGESARSRVSREYSSDASAHRWLAIYERVVRGGLGARFHFRAGQ